MLASQSSPIPRFNLSCGYISFIFQAALMGTSFSRAKLCIVQIGTEGIIAKKKNRVKV
jgi:hypothetical protein